jgi:outer membrane protein OmpA-like peptidoglycan-associated protein
VIRPIPGIDIEVPMKACKQYLTSTTAVAALALAGCASAPKVIPQVESARAAVSAARADAGVTRNSPQELERATQLLSSAEEAAKRSSERDAAAHLGYLAEQTAKLAMQRSRAAQAEARVAAAQGERDKVLLQAREAEAARARQAAASAQVENQRLSRELADLQAKPTDRGTVLTLGGDVLFATGRAELKGGAERMLAQVQRFLEANPERRVRIEGFTDSTGSDEYNLDLSRRRADAVARALASRGVDPSRIQTSGLGEAYPVADNTSPGGRQLNRRVEIIIGNDSAEVAGR